MKAPPRIFITGASSGLGHTLAARYGAAGATLGLVARRAEPLRALAAELAAPVAVYPADVRDGEALRQAAADFLARFGCPDIVIANAGISVGTRPELAEDIAVFEEVFDVNVMGAVRTFQPFVAAMRAAGRGRLAGIASVAGLRGLPGAAAYSASKAALVNYLEALRVELHGSGVRVVTVCPGYVATPMTAKNPFPMPFLLDADEAAAKIAAVIDRGDDFAIVPWQMALAGKILARLPNFLFDRLLARAPRKPRRSPTAPPGTT